MGRTGPHNGLSVRMLEKIFLFRNIDIEYKTTLGYPQFSGKIVGITLQRDSLEQCKLEPESVQATQWDVAILLGSITADSRPQKGPQKG